MYLENGGYMIFPRRRGLDLFYLSGLQEDRTGLIMLLHTLYVLLTDPWFTFF